MPARIALLASVLLAAAAGLRGQTDDFWREHLEETREALQRGKLSLAFDGFDEIMQSAQDDPEDERPSAAVVRAAQAGLLRIDLIRGRYARVCESVATLPAATAGRPEFRELLAQASARRGDHETALKLRRELVEARPDDLASRYEIGRLLYYRGQRDAGREVWRKCIEHGTSRRLEDAASLTALGDCHVALGGRDNIEAASAYYVRAIRAAPKLPGARIALGNLKFQVYGEAAGMPSGERDLKKVLENNGEVEAALIGLYRLRRTNMVLDYGKTDQYLQRALSLNENSVPALMERGIALLDDRRFETAAQRFDKALQVNGRDKEVLAHRSVAAMLMGEADLAESLRETALEVDPGFGPEIDRIFGDHLVALYRFADAIPYYERALAEQPDSVPALHGLAKAMVYTGRGADAVGLLERAKELQKGYVNAWRNNALAVQKLLEEEYVTLESGGFRFKIHRDDVAVLEAYLPRWHSEAMRVLGAKYGHLPPEPVTVEVFHTWSDFSVRTIGFRGFSALGACFGRFITLVSPSDDLLRRQNFMWSATVWHEYAHVLTLALSDHRVPRWLTEGLSVHEERQKNPAWERGMDRELLDAWANREIPPVRLLNRLFRGPKILFGYFLGGQVVDYLAEHHGFDKVVELLKGYGADRGTEQLFRDVFGISTRDFDRRFLAWIEKEKLDGLRIRPRYSNGTIEKLLEELARRPKDPMVRLQLGWAYAQRDNPIDAGEQLRVVLAREPKHPEGLLLHAELLRRRGANDAAVEAYRAGLAGGADDFDSRVRFGRLLEKLGKVDDAIEQYQRAKACWPNCTEEANAPNLLLARLLRKLGKRTEALMELKAFVSRTARAFDPRLELAAMERENGNHAAEAKLLEEAVQIDPFMRSLHERLARAYLDLGRKKEALDELVVALAVRPEADRAHLGKPEKPDADSPAEKQARAALCVRIAVLAHQLGERDAARRYAERAVSEAPGSEPSSRAAELLREWGG